MARPRGARVVALALAVMGSLPAACIPPDLAAPGAAGASAPASPTASPRRTFVRPTPTPEPTFATYIVRTGDSLTSIARSFRTTPRSIALWNRDAYPSLDPSSDHYAPDRIGVGWRLLVKPGVVVDESDLGEPSPSATADAS